VWVIAFKRLKAKYLMVGRGAAYKPKRLGNSKRARLSRHEGNINLKIEQAYRQVKTPAGGLQWFPEQLNFEFSFLNTPRHFSESGHPVKVILRK